MLTILNTAREIGNAKVDIAVLPVGAIEQHSGHLPIGTDTLVAQEISKRVAEKLDAYLLPAVGVASSIEHSKTKGTVYLKAETIIAIIRDIAHSLHDTGFKRLLVISGHGGNWILKPAVRQVNRELENMQVLLVDASTVATNKVSSIIKNKQNDVHAGEKETSIMLYLYNELVREIEHQENPQFFAQAFMDYYDTSELTELGYWGFPEDATREKGEKIVGYTIESILEHIAEVDKVEEKLGRKKFK
jgi:creatinine amidohydrolase